ncbi:hypothetical protein BDQ12DRAFT_739242 [Crucibulum laeve]|uniref:Uncharacterized protein n=1 Tax=Crucibulum laeve TaxID=68775 RepID=A0A5C3LIV3_9AGAR|nr:hypothetical protein BDQ12DRAFT_739242 [Crucibulum laeve]
MLLKMGHSRAHHLMLLLYSASSKVRPSLLASSSSNLILPPHHLPLRIIKYVPLDPTDDVKVYQFATILSVTYRQKSTESKIERKVDNGGLVFKAA